jgi:hypothetical protein
VLFESFEDGMAIGHTDTFLEVAAPSPVPLHSVPGRVRLLRVQGDRLIAELQEVLP